jgi:hypothetical protein
MLFLAVPGAPADRGWLERNLIGLMSEAARERFAVPSAAWLGGNSPRQNIRESGLWNINCLEHHYEAAVVDEVAKRVAMFRTAI